MTATLWFPCYLCFGGGGGCALCECCGGSGSHRDVPPTECRLAKRNVMGKACESCGALWDEPCAETCPVRMAETYT